MNQTDIAVQNRRRPRRRRHRLAGPVFVFILAVAVCMAAFFNAEDKQVGIPPTNTPVQNDPTQKDPPQNDLAQTGHGTPTAPKPVAAGTWKLLLVNSRNPLTEDYSIQTVTLKNGLQVDKRCYPDLQAMMDACRADGLSPVICSAYRSWEYQERLFKKKVNALIAQGYSESDAIKEAGKVAAVPGTSEHQTGLAVDIVDINYQLLDENQERTAVQKWLLEHSWEYGFVLRYPSEKSDITGIIYEPWHYRYVGREDAKQIHDLGVCLEEYLEPDIL